MPDSASASASVSRPNQVFPPGASQIYRMRSSLNGPRKRCGRPAWNDRPARAVNRGRRGPDPLKPQNTMRTLGSRSQIRPPAAASTKDAASPELRSATIPGSLSGTPALIRSGPAPTVWPITLRWANASCTKAHRGRLVGELRRALGRDAQHHRVEQHGRTAGELEVGRDRLRRSRP